MKVIHSSELLCSCSLFIIFPLQFYSSNLTAAAWILCCLWPTRVPVITNIAPVLCGNWHPAVYFTLSKSIHIGSRVCSVQYGQTWNAPTAALWPVTAVCETRETNTESQWTSFCFKKNYVCGCCGANRAATWNSVICVYRISCSKCYKYCWRPSFWSAKVSARLISLLRYPTLPSSRFLLRTKSKRLLQKFALIVVLTNVRRQ